MQFSERILVHVPSRRPTIDQILASQWINHQNITLESALVPPSKPASKKMHWFARNQLRHKNGDLSIDLNLVQLFFNTKRANSVLEENFLHPIVVPPPEEINTLPENLSKPRRKSLFGNSLKKKIGPMEDKTKGHLFNRNSIDGKAINTEQVQCLRKAAECNSKKNSISNPIVDEEEQGEFIMSPSNADVLTECHPLEIEARHILDKLGITSEMLCRSIESGPRSDIIGAYRIVVHRLQKQQLLTKRNELVAAAAAEIEPSIKPKNNRNNNRTCAIL